MILNHFNTIISKIIFKNKNIILIYFQIKNILKYNYNQIPKHPQHAITIIVIFEGTQPHSRRNN
jgi:hypothetical protein